jgi:Fur family zinc uptake transcriptional regulator
MTQCGEHGHTHGPEEILQSAERACKRAGLRLTDIRRQVLSLIAQDPRPIKAYDLMAQLGGERGRPAAPPTIYRALEFLLEHGFIHRIESLNAYVTCPHPTTSHRSQFLICDRCQRTIELEDSDLSRRLGERAAAQGFKPMRELIEIHGICRECQRRAA